MSPQERQQFEDMKTRLNNLERVENVAFAELIKRRIVDPAITTALANLYLTDLVDVSGTTGASTGQVLKKTATTWQPGTDNV